MCIGVPMGPVDCRIGDFEIDELLINAPKHMQLIIICFTMLSDLSGAEPHNVMSK
jgi:hypothetical protein